ncbi:hypothetical protein FRX31_016103 [Thalictrum thalictroides]|uniref:Zinc finger PHD-type domain-containing protein n=1 Tax=Thalictrum thalictroides TaxID=46969 RepID=A0A7J6WDP9_THATH|nr:hypothetical protein FRX31_016103 [Thalictrum thalictroides]
MENSSDSNKSTITAESVRKEVCDQCGDKGLVTCLIVCAICQVAMRHHYCLDVLPRVGEQPFYVCERCMEDTDEESDTTDDDDSSAQSNPAYI